MDAASKTIRIGLALSGGGFRASFFHLGTIRYLEETGIMPQVEVVSTVSGGSILGAYYLVEMERKLRADPDRNRLEACDEIINEFCDKVGLNFRMRALVFYPFFHPVQTLLALLRLRHSGDTMAKAFERHLFTPELRVGDLPVERPLLDDDARGGETRTLINTTSIISGRRVVFSRESDTGLSAQIEKSDPNNISLARVVGASAAVPGLFKPLRIGNDALVDGGVVDNQGLESLFDYFRITKDSLNLLAESARAPANENGDDEVYLIVSDAAGQFAVKDDVKATRAGSAARSTGVLQAANRRKVLQRLLDKKGAEVTGFAFTHLAMNLKGSPGVGHDRLPSEFIGPVAELRTDLDAFTRLERDALIYHGYTLMRHQIRTYCQSLVPDSPSERSYEKVPPEKLFSWPPPFVELTDPRNGNDRRATRARLEIERLLKVGREALFRDVRRYPATFVPLLLAALIVGRFLAYLVVQVGELDRWVAERLSDTVCGLIPRVRVPGVVDLESLDAAFRTSGAYWGALELTASVACVALCFYVSLWLYWQTKERLDLPSKSEESALKKLTSETGRTYVAGDGKAR